MKNLFRSIAIIAALALSFSASAKFVTVADYSVGTSVSKTVGTVKITGTESTYSEININDIVKDYDININPCSDCGSNGGVDDYKVKGDYTQWDSTNTDVNRMQNIDITTTGTFCDVKTDLGNFSAGYTKENYTTDETVIVQVADVTRSRGGSKFTGDIYNGNVKVGDTLDTSSYDRTAVSDITTTQTRSITGWKVSTYIGK